MEKTETATKGKIILATVKGDVHDIGKNLVEIILSNNGYQIVNLGIKVAPEQLVEAYHREKPDAIGLSGLLVKSAQQMVITAQDLKAAGIDVPILVGGAALTRKFTNTRIAPEYDGLVLYAKDAMNGLELANQLSDPQEREKLIAKMREMKKSDVARSGRAESSLPPKSRPLRSNVSRDVPVFVPPDLKPHVLKNVPLSHILPYVNMQMLLGHHLGLRGSVEKLLAEKDPKALELKAVVDEIVQEAVTNGIIQTHGKYRFFPAQSSGNDILIYDPEDHSRVIQTFSFPRQQSEPYLCLADFLKPADSGVMDYVGFFVVTAGQGIRELAERWKEQGDYLRSHALQAVALEVAEGFAERVHHMMRDVWGFPDPVTMTMKERHGARYQGIRVSFGYPACPDLEDQKLLFALLEPEEIGVHLTEGCMMEPEASVSAMVFAHPEARYFNVEKVEN
jgi:5-methyltetrahydrofolate--homocysteine methyltransferase